MRTGVTAPPVPAGLALAALLALAGCHRGEAPAEATPQPVSVATAVAQVETITDRVTGSGTIVPALAAEWTVYAPDAAEVAELPWKEGDHVDAGDLLVRFEVASVTEAVTRGEADQAAAKARIDTAKAALDKATNLSAGGYVPRNAVDEARSALIAAESALTQAETALSTAQARRDQMAVHARFAGTVAKIWHPQGDAVTASTSDPVLRLIDPTRVQALITMRLADALRVVPGEPATVVPPGGAAEAATVAMRAPTTDPSSQTADLRLSFNGATALTVDAPVDAEVVLDQRAGVLAVPRAAVLKDDDATFVLVAGDDNVAHRRVVDVGFTTKDRVQILKGLAAGDRVITSGFDQVADGTPILIER